MAYFLALRGRSNFKIVHEKKTGIQGAIPSRQVAIVGVGNLLLSDEGVGIHVVRTLREVSMPSHCIELFSKS